MSSLGVDLQHLNNNKGALAKVLHVTNTFQNFFLTDRATLEKEMYVIGVSVRRDIFIHLALLTTRSKLIAKNGENLSYMT